MSQGRSLKLGHEQAYLFVGDEYDGATTRDRDGALWAVRARLRVPGLDASALVHLSESPPQDLLLPAFFAGLVGGWHVLREWRAYDGGRRVLRALLARWLGADDQPAAPLREEVHDEHLDRGCDRDRGERPEDPRHLRADEHGDEHDERRELHRPPVDQR